MVPIDPRAEDLAAAIFWLRTRRLRPGDAEYIPVLTGKRRTMAAVVVKALPLETPAGTFPAVLVAHRHLLAGKLFEPQGH